MTTYNIKKYLRITFPNEPKDPSPPPNVPRNIYLEFEVDNYTNKPREPINRWNNIKSNCDTENTLNNVINGTFTYLTGRSTTLIESCSFENINNIPSTMKLSINSISKKNSEQYGTGMSTFTDTDVNIEYQQLEYYLQDTPFTTCCFSQGTKILCLTEYLMEEYRLVQDLIVGDLVKTYMNDYKPIKNILQGSFVNDPKNRSNCMYIMKKTENNGLIEDLMVTGNHGILLDEKDFNEEEQKKNPKWASFKVDDKINCIAGVSSKFEQIKDNKVYNYYHFTLDNGDGKRRRFGVYANGILMETPP
jgi:hypothetical protein